MPFGFKEKDGSKQYLNWEECVSDQMGRGYSRESAERICGWIKHKTEKQ